MSLLEELAWAAEFLSGLGARNIDVVLRDDRTVAVTPDTALTPKEERAFMSPVRLPATLAALMLERGPTVDGIADREAGRRFVGEFYTRAGWAQYGHAVRDARRRRYHEVRHEAAALDAQAA